MAMEKSKEESVRGIGSRNQNPYVSVTAEGGDRKSKTLYKSFNERSMATLSVSPPKRTHSQGGGAILVDS